MGAGVLTFIEGRDAGSVALEVSNLDNKLFKSSSLVSAPVFFVVGEPTEIDVPSLKARVVLILSAYVENLRGRVSAGPRKSRLDCPDILLVPREGDTEEEREGTSSENPSEAS